MNTSPFWKNHLQTRMNKTFILWSSNFLHIPIYWFILRMFSFLLIILLIAKLSSDPVCPSSVGLSVGLSWFPNREGSYNSMLLLEHLLTYQMRLWGRLRNFSRSFGEGKTELPKHFFLFIYCILFLDQI